MPPTPPSSGKAPNSTAPEFRARRAIVAFYASLHHGSEYRAGAEFVRFAAEAGFDLAVIADLTQNSSPAELSAAASGIAVSCVPSAVVQQQWLYRFTDFLPQLIWHRRVARFLKARHPGLDTVWVQNGALPWLPVAPYRGAAPVFIWGPAGGGETLPGRVLETLGTKTRWREKLRRWLEASSVRRKRSLFSGSAFSNVILLARTSDAQKQLQSLLDTHEVPVIPEILEPVPAVRLDRQPCHVPRFIWVGQDIPRKNLPLAIRLFQSVRAEAFPAATLDVYGVGAVTATETPHVRFHGWVPSIDWPSYRDDGVLLLTSYREGLPSAVLEAIREGLLCVASDVGSVSSLNVPTLHVLPNEQYPDYDRATVSALVSRIILHLATARLDFGPVSYRQGLLDYLQKKQA